MVFNEVNVTVRKKGMHDRTFRSGRDKHVPPENPSEGRACRAR
ncbi:hypothetical protein THTE_0066 [Thermogutta terrifontis]|uniref:Uncharacterized protein n=1 Tax=Thermogutta terrifontis TaxID=1331910 RepID=A0A286R9M9_9BACT|nr:hypothetical protein THTE_0066 [Thermogutta terrifontis]